MSGSPADGAARQATIRALQATMTAENAAVFGYGVAGAHLIGAKRAAAQRDWVAHESGRDALAALLLSRAGPLAPAATAYKLPFPVHNPTAAAALAAYLEDRVATAYLGLVALTDAELRSFGARGVRSAALRAAAWRGRTLAFPGFDLPATGHIPTSEGPFPASSTSPPSPAPDAPAASPGPATTTTTPASPTSPASTTSPPATSAPATPSPSPP
jgi:Domain of unknown function (DUF4439)